MTTHAFGPALLGDKSQKAGSSDRIFNVFANDAEHSLALRHKFQK
jgi:hypothetical protein